MNRLFAALFACALSFGVAHAATPTATPATLAAQVKAAQPGDVVQLAPGAYGAVKLQNLVKTAPVVIEGAPGAALTSLDGTGSAFLTFDGLEVIGTANAAAVWFGPGSHDLTFRNGKVHNTNPAQGSAVVFNKATNITVDHNELYNLGSGVGVQSSTGAVVSNNAFHDIASDGIDITDAVGAKITGNTGTNFHPPAQAHPDFIQFWGLNTNGLDIENNRYDRATGGVAQGIFGEDGANVTIKGNILRGTMFNGIGLSRTKGAVISGNFVDGYPDMTTWIIVRDACDSVTITGNATPTVTNYTAAPACTNVTISGNTTVALAALGDDALLTAWLGIPALQAQIAAAQAQLAQLQQQLQTAEAALAH